MEGSTEDFLRLLNESNARILAREAKLLEEIPVDPVRLQREQERRDRLGTLRAREHPRSRPHQVHNVFGHTPLDH